MKWFRFYSEVLDDPKVQRLPPHLFRTWVNLLCLASASGGRLPSSDDVAFRLRMSPNDTAQQMDDLILAGLVDIAPGGALHIHKWAERQFVSDDSKERVRRHRALKKQEVGNDDVTVTVTPPEQNRTDSDTDTETPLPPSADRSPEEGIQKYDLSGLGRVVGVRQVSADAKRRAAVALRINDATPLVALYEGWKGSKRAKDPDAHFLATAPKLYAEAAPPVRAACGPIPDDEPEIAPKAVRASSQLVAALTRRR